MANKQTSPIIIWRFTDGKIGHEKQSQAFIEALEDVREIEVTDVKVTRHTLYYLFLWLFRMPIYSSTCSKLSQRPDLIIGTGHKTHIPLLLTKRQQRCKSIVIMSPSLPAHFFDAIVAPEHDYISKEKPQNAITTLTALAPTIKSQPQPTKGLILLGGESKHFYWDNNKIVKKIEDILLSHSKEIIWQLSDSRRTPHDTMQSIREKCAAYENISLFHHEDIERDWLKDQLMVAGHIWVTADSASMLAEALNTQADVGLISLSPKKDSCKIDATNNNLIRLGYLKKDYRKESTHLKQRPQLSDVVKKTLALLEL